MFALSPVSGLRWSYRTRRTEVPILVGSASVSRDFGRFVDGHGVTPTFSRHVSRCLREMISCLGGSVQRPSLPMQLHGADSADDAVGVGVTVSACSDDEAEGVVGSGGAFFEEAEGAGVAPDRSAVAKLVFVRNRGGTGPVKEVLLDGFAHRV
jgi:hypothetical protein